MHIGEGGVDDDVRGGSAVNDDVIVRLHDLRFDNDDVGILVDETTINTALVHHVGRLYSLHLGTGAARRVLRRLLRPFVARARAAVLVRMVVRHFGLFLRAIYPDLPLGRFFNRRAGRFARTGHGRRRFFRPFREVQGATAMEIEEGDLALFLLRVGGVGGAAVALEGLLRLVARAFFYAGVAAGVHVGLLGGPFTFLNNIK